MELHPLLVFLAQTLGATIGSLYDPVIWLMIVLVFALGWSHGRWWGVPIIAVIINALKLPGLLAFWKLAGIYHTWPKQLVWMLWPSLILASLGYLIGRYATRLVRDKAP